MTIIPMSWQSAFWTNSRFLTCYRHFSQEPRLQACGLLVLVTQAQNFSPVIGISVKNLRARGPAQGLPYGSCGFNVRTFLLLVGLRHEVVCGIKNLGFVSGIKSLESTHRRPTHHPPTHRARARAPSPPGTSQQRPRVLYAGWRRLWDARPGG